MFNKKDFINWAQTAQNDNKPMQDFRSSHFNPMKQVQQEQEAVQVEESKGKALLNLAKTVATSKTAKKVGKKALVKTAEYGAVKGGEMAIDGVANKLTPTPKEPKPVDVHASYDARKEAGMRAFREFFGHQKKLGLGKKQIKQRADQSAAQTGYGGSGTRAFKFGRSVEPKPKPKV